MTRITINSKNKEYYATKTFLDVTFLYWHLKELDANILKNFPNLESLICCYQCITDLSPIRYCPGLKILNCAFNLITDLAPVRYCKQLEIINCAANRGITNLDPLKDLPKLKKIEYRGCEVINPESFTNFL